MPQEEINCLLIRLAKEGKQVVRLKGGDPYVFGRGGEEGDALKKAGIPFEVIPGITSAIGGLAYAGIPITSRGYTSSFHIMTGHLKEASNKLNYEAIAKLNGTLVFLMGIGHLEEIVSELITQGKNTDTKVAIIYRATTPYQKTVVGTLGTITDLAKKAKICPPGLIVIGDVVGLREELNFFEEKPLFGKRIVVTRSRAQASSMVEKIENLGGEALQCPVIKIQPINQKALEKAVKQIKNYQHLVLTSTNGVCRFFDTLLELDLDMRELASVKITAVGEKTAEKIRSYSIKPDLIPETYVGEAVANLLQEYIHKEDKLLIPRSRNARPFLVEALSKKCHVTEIASYETVKEETCYDTVVAGLREGTIEYVTFTCTTTVENFIDGLNEEARALLRNVKLVSIGPITSNKIKSYGYEVYKEADVSTIDGVVEVLVNDC